MSLLSRLLVAAILGLSLCAGVVGAKSDSAGSAAAKLLPDQIGSFKAAGAAIPMTPDQAPRLFGEESVVRNYALEGLGRYSVQLQTTANDAEAFALLTHVGSYFKRLGTDLKLSFNEIGTASLNADGRIFFYKGNAFVAVTATNNEPSAQTKELAVNFASTLNSGEGEIPVLVKHLPDWETNGKNAVYAVTLDELKEVVTIPGQPTEQSKGSGPGQPQPVLDALTFEGGTEAVAANYGQAQLVIIEFTTPQFSIDTDSRIWTRLAELKTQGQPTPNAYRRVGNYSVLVFNAADERTANSLIDQVKYEQVVQWLGDDPHLADRLQKYFTQTSAGVLVAVVKSSGLSLLLCLAIGGAIGALLFRHRRAQRTAAFSDAGGSIRLNLDELTGSGNTRRLLSTSEKSPESRP